MTVEAPSPLLNGSLDYAQPLELGFLVPDAGDPLGVLEIARLLDRLGYDLVGVQDHPYQPRHLDTLSLLAAILAQTEAVRVFADVGNLPLRPNVVIDRAAREAGRDPPAIRRIYNVKGPFTGSTQGPAADIDQSITGPPEHWAEVLTHLTLDIGFSTFVHVTPPDPHTLATFIEEVAPQVREHVAERRASSPVPASSPERGT